jgi:hypothetical protein
MTTRSRPSRPSGGEATPEEIAEAQQALDESQ